ncbi:MAG: TAT-variant-translocated molybdopterin oxidoreductase, partial [Verrucomicrobiota bacterium]
MKTIPPICPEPEVGPKYWRSLDQLADSPEFNKWVEREFPAGASEFNDPVSRRHFVKIMSASFLLGGLGLTGCRQPEQHILPFSKMPEGYIHGVAQYYATSRPTRGSAIPLLVKSSDGRPTKIEGNPQHPDSRGGTDTFTQASIL